MFQQIFLFEGKTQNGQTNDKSYDVDADDSAVIDGARPKRILILDHKLLIWLHSRLACLADLNRQ